MQFFHSDEFTFPLPEGHTFPQNKYALLTRRVVASGLTALHGLHVPCGVTDTEIERAHTPAYWRSFRMGQLGEREMRRIGLPWSTQLVDRIRRSCGGTLEACRAALRDGCAVNLAGGTHHAFADHGAGYCVINDSAVAARALQADGLCRRILIVDCDVHQGDGTAAIFAADETVITFSIHGAKNYPFHKQHSDLDIEMPDGADDVTYLSALGAGLRSPLAASRPDLAIYLAGADPFQDDRLGRLSLSKAGLLRRDELVLHQLRSAGIPVAITLAGGYGRCIDDTVDIHMRTIQAACSGF